MESGSSVKLTWVIDNLDKFAYEGETYSVLFKKPAEYKLTVRNITILSLSFKTVMQYMFYTQIQCSFVTGFTLCLIVIPQSLNLLLGNSI